MKTTTNKTMSVLRQLFGLALVLVVGISMVPSAAFADAKPKVDNTPIVVTPVTTHTSTYTPVTSHPITYAPTSNYSDNSIKNSGNDSTINIPLTFTWLSNKTTNTNTINNTGAGSSGSIYSTNNTTNSNALGYDYYDTPYTYGGYNGTHVTYDYNGDHSYSYGDYSGTNVTYAYNDHSYTYDDYHSPKPAPSCSINASNRNINDGDSVTLTWNSSNATSASLSEGGSVGTNGSRTVSPNGDTTYVLSVSGAGGSSNCSVNVNVNNNHNNSAAPSCDLTVSDDSITEGDSTTLHWYVTGNVDSASINQGIGSVGNGSGSKRVSPDTDTTYRMTVRNEAGSRTCSATVSVDPDNQNNVSLNITPVTPVGNQPYTSVYLADAPYTGAGDTTAVVGSIIAIALALAAIGYFLFVKGLPFAFKRATVQNAPIAAAATSKKSQAKAIRVGGIDQDEVYAFMNAYAANDTTTMQSIRAAIKTRGVGEDRLASRVSFAATDALTARKFGGATENALLSIDEATLETLAA